MFYENRKIIYTVLIIIALSGAFFIGKKVGASTNITFSKTTGQESKSTVENINYNNDLQIKGDKYSLDYTIENAILLDKGTMNFNINVQNNNNVNNLKVVAKDQNNENLDLTPNSSDDKNSLNYTVKFDDTQVTTISIIVYPLAKDIADNNNLNLSTVPFKITKLDIGLIKKQQIENLQN